MTIYRAGELKPRPDFSTTKQGRTAMKMIPTAKIILIAFATAAFGLSVASASLIAPHGPVAPTPVSVPDAGSTAALLSLALAGVAILRHKLTRP